MHIRSQLSFSSGKKRIAFLISCFLIYSDLPQAFQCSPKEAALLLVIVLLISWKLALGCSAWRGTKEKLPLVRPKLRHVMKREIFVCVNAFLFSKSIFKKTLNLGAVYHPGPPHHSCPCWECPFRFSSPSQSQFPSYTFQHNRALRAAVLSSELQKAPEYRSFAHSCIILFNKLIRITVVSQMPGKYRGLCIRSPVLGNELSRVFLISLLFLLLWVFLKEFINFIWISNSFLMIDNS